MVIFMTGLVVLLAGWYFGQLALTALWSLVLFAAWHLVNILRLYDWLKSPTGEPPKSLGLWADLFNQVCLMEQRNRKQKKRYRRVIRDFRKVTDAFPDAILMVDKSTSVTWINQAAERLLDLKKDSDIGRPIGNLLRNSEFSNWVSVDNKETGKLEVQAPGLQNTWLEIESFPIQKGRRLIILRDISDIHNLNQVRKDFVTNVSHELRTPLTVMRGYLETLLDRPEEELRTPLGRMHTQAMQMQSMLDDLLELSRLQDVDAIRDFESVDVSAILLQLREQAEDISRGRHALQFELDPELGLTGVRPDLESAFRNLIVNALKYTPEGGKISVSWANSEFGPVLTVSDTGIGIPQREIPRLTERFYRVGSSRGRESGGTGLGLAIVKHVLSAHDAQLEIRSDIGVGSQFICRFPPHRTVS